MQDYGKDGWFFSRRSRKLLHDSGKAFKEINCVATISADYLLTTVTKGRLLFLILTSANLNPVSGWRNRQGECKSMLKTAQKLDLNHKLYDKWPLMARCCLDPGKKWMESVRMSQLFVLCIPLEWCQLCLSFSFSCLSLLTLCISTCLLSPIVSMLKHRLWTFFSLSSFREYFIKNTNSIRPSFNLG